METPELIASEAPVRTRSRTSKFIWVLAAFALSVAVTVRWLLMPIQVSGNSMWPTYQDGSLHLLYKRAYNQQPPRRFDVVAIEGPDGELYIKRVIGLPNEHIAIVQGRIFIDGRLLQENELPGVVPWKISPTKLDGDDYFVIGDNRATSILGAINRDRILGRVIY